MVILLCISCSFVGCIEFNCGECYDDVVIDVVYFECENQDVCDGMGVGV